MTRGNNHENGEARGRKKRKYQKESKKRRLATDINFLLKRIDEISAGNIEIQILVDPSHENFGIREVDNHGDLRANLS